MTIDDASKALAELVPKVNDALLRKIAPHYLSVPTHLFALGITDDAGRVPLEVVTPENKTVTAAVLAMEQGGDAKTVSGVDPNATPPHGLQSQRSTYWAQAIEAGRVVYFQYNKCRSDSANPFENMQAQLEKMLAEPNVERLVIDLRNNGGGSSPVLDPFIDWLAGSEKWSVNSRTTVLIGRRTFSSAILNAIRLKQNAHAVLIGEPTSGKPNHYGQVMSFRLPNSELEVFYSTKHFRYSTEDTDSLMPDVLVELTSKDYFAGADPVLDAALSYKQ